MSTEVPAVVGGAELCHDGAAPAARRPPKRSPGMLQAHEAVRIAHTLIGKYGGGALLLARARAARALEIGDDLALDAWQAVIEATQRLLRRRPSGV